MQQLLLTVKEAASRLNLSESSVRTLIANQAIPHVRLGRAVRVPIAALERSIEANTIEITRRKS